MTISIMELLNKDTPLTSSTSETSGSIWQMTSGIYVSKGSSFTDEFVLRGLQEEKEVDDKVSLFLLSESSLAKDWLKPEEDKAWKDL